jgi:hypothetical protein
VRREALLAPFEAQLGESADAMFGLGSNNSMYDKKPGLKMIWCMLVTQEVPSGLITCHAFQKHPEAGFGRGE